SIVDKLTKEEIAMYKLMFSFLDKDGDGQLTAEELYTLMQVFDKKLKIRFTKTEFQYAFNKKYADGKMDFIEFLTLMISGLDCTKDSEKDSEEDSEEGSEEDSEVEEWVLDFIFRSMDKDGNGFISAAELKHFFDLFE